MFIATPIGIFLAVLLDRELKGSSFYQSVFYLPVVLALAVVGIIIREKHFFYIRITNHFHASV